MMNKILKINFLNGSLLLFLSLFYIFYFIVTGFLLRYSTTRFYRVKIIP